MASSIDEFLRILQRGPSDTEGVFNPWRDCDERDRAPRREAPRIRRENMAAYLEARRLHARVLLLGEAPSHRGCRFSGIAFCSEFELLHKADLVAHRPLAVTSREAPAKPQRERSAAVIWGEIERIGAPYGIVLWNAFPWHPHGVEGVSSNRKPRIAEVRDGRDALAALLACFTHPLEIFAVGRVAEDALGRWEGLECRACIRHPAQGGESRFRSQFRSLVAARL